MTGVIYVIRNSVNGKVYVGQTKNGVRARWRGHLHQAQKGCEFPLHRAIRKYGAPAFTIEVVENAVEMADNLNALERSWIARLNSRDSTHGYNVAHGGEGGYGAGLPKHYRAEHSRRMTGSGNPSFGKPFPAVALSGTKAAKRWVAEHPEEHRANCKKASVSSWKDLTEEQRAARLAPMQKARWRQGAKTWSNPESRRALALRMTGSGNPFFGRKHTAETKAKSGLAIHLAAQRRKQNQGGRNGMAA